MPTRRLLLSLALVAGCRATPAAPPNRAARRVVSLAPSATEVLYALGAGDRVVGVTIFDDHPPAVRDTPRVGGIVNPSFEAIAALRPDALVGVQGPLDRAVLDRVAALGVRLEFPRAESVDEVLASIERFADVVDRRAEGAALRRRLQRELDAVSASVSGRRRVRVVAAFGASPLVVAGRGSWVDGVLSIAGGENAVRSEARYPTLSIEVILRAAPDVILDLSPGMGGGDLAATLSAHQGAVPRIIALRDNVFLRPGPRVGEAARRLALALHPGLTSQVSDASP